MLWTIFADFIAAAASVAAAIAASKSYQAAAGARGVAEAQALQPILVALTAPDLLAGLSTLREANSILQKYIGSQTPLEALFEDRQKIEAAKVIGERIDVVIMQADAFRQMNVISKEKFRHFIADTPAFNVWCSVWVPHLGKLAGETCGRRQALAKEFLITRKLQPVSACGKA
jgi:hypothetical protein